MWALEGSEPGLWSVGSDCLCEGRDAVAVSALRVCKDPDDLAARAAELVIGCGREAAKQSRRFTLALAGGSTPERLYQLLGQNSHAAAVAWKLTYLFFGDERFVPPDDARSNFCLVKRTLLDRPVVQPAGVFPMVAPGRSVRECATEYAAALARFFSLGNGPPRFDLILLGL